ncbi:DUF3099 domain-containing protein [Microlunatus flavus]|uniref:DUF3099 domain-containing protein n=1 Tax=Microlunatus flavus TaxID=1036181 RepID=A0A1H9GW07_9ACTN|nr:DUF3099 domain-containing protein [Microlunatus flavus]SEQ54271.1 Protein of unknown function [Microlunatus flavus]
MAIPSGATNITDARAGTSVDMSQRIRRYTITMAFRTVCFLVAVIFAHGWLQWTLFAGAVFLPYMAVLLANQSNTKGLKREVRRGAPGDAKQLTAMPSGEYVEGEVVVDDEGGVHEPSEERRRYWAA